MGQHSKDVAMAWFGADLGGIKSLDWMRLAGLISPSLAKSTIRALQTTFWGVFRLRTSPSNPSRSALLIEIRSIVLISPDSQV
jgi:hypothetical protein